MTGVLRHARGNRLRKTPILLDRGSALSDKRETLALCCRSLVSYLGAGTGRGEVAPSTLTKGQPHSIGRSSMGQRECYRIRMADGNSRRALASSVASLSF